MIVPTLNEERLLASCLRSLQGTAIAEVIVVDGGSTDQTRRVAEEHGARLVDSEPGRARQMNAAAAVARGDVLLCVHADTVLPSEFGAAVIETLDDERVALGAFRLRIDSTRSSLRWIERLVDWRSRHLGLPYGDQALFFPRKLFEEVEGYPCIPVMEDFELVRRLRRRGRVVVLQQAVKTSARRWLERGVARTTALNQACMLGHLLGVSPDRLARWRG